MTPRVLHAAGVRLGARDDAINRLAVPLLLDWLERAQRPQAPTLQGVIKNVSA